jgi:Flp pilus assembly protein TadG
MQLFIERIRRFRTAAEGAAAVEFALIFPLLILIFLNTASLFDGFRASRQLERAASVTTDLVTRFDGVEFTEDDFDLIQATAESILGNYATDSNFTMTVSSVRNFFDDEDELEVHWSESNDDDALLEEDDLAQFDFPTLAEGDTVIVVQLSLEHSALFVSDIVGDFSLNDFHIRRPRFKTEIVHEDDS